MAFRLSLRWILDASIHEPYDALKLSDALYRSTRSSSELIVTATPLNGALQCCGLPSPWSTQFLILDGGHTVGGIADPQSIRRSKRHLSCTAHHDLGLR